MTLVVFDRGTRIKTPVSSIFPSRRIEANAAATAEPAVPDDDNHARTQAEHLTQEYQRFTEMGRAHSQAVQAYQSHTDEEKKPAAPKITASHVMNQPVYTTRRDTRLIDALRIMDEQSINHLMVTNDEEVAVGLISRIDILRHPLNTGIQVQDAYREQFLVATPETDVTQIAINLVTYHIGSVPVIDENDKILGMITRTDLLKLLISNAQIENWV